MSLKSSNESRRAERFGTSIPASVKGRDDHDSFWKQDTGLVSVSRIGASFYLERECPVGQLISLLFPMPKHFRSYDPDEINYRVWGLVQHCHSVASDDEAMVYQVGVAFIGKSAPPSYYQNPQQSYRIAGIGEDGLWKISETERPFVTRREARFPVSLEVVIELLNEEKIVISEEKTMTANLSFSGAAVYSNLSAKTGDWVYFTCNEYDFFAPAIVRARSVVENEPDVCKDKHSKLHLQFIDDKFPLEEVREI